MARALPGRVFRDRGLDVDLGRGVAHPPAHGWIEGDVQLLDEDLALAGSGTGALRISKSSGPSRPVGRRARMIWVLVRVMETRVLG